MCIRDSLNGNRSFCVFFTTLGTSFGRTHPTYSSTSTLLGLESRSVRQTLGRCFQVMSDVFSVHGSCSLAPRHPRFICCPATLRSLLGRTASTPSLPRPTKSEPSPANSLAAGLVQDVAWLYASPLVVIPRKHGSVSTTFDCKTVQLHQLLWST